MGVAELFDNASDETQRLVTDLLQQDRADRVWGEQIGPSLTQRDTARLLGKSETAVSKDPKLLRIRTRSRRVVYPVVQFNGRVQQPGVADVVTALSPVLEPLTIASWLTAPNPMLEGARPIDALRHGRTDDVVDTARVLARSAA